MSYTRVFIFENPKGFASQMKRIFKPHTKPMLDKLTKEKTIDRWSLIQIGDNTAMLVMEFANKAKMNKALKTTAAHRDEVAADETGMQWWAYHGPVKASG
jgi:hypothetical protein|tara:strand:- start:77 stop:376 length:300 start_codon:yes stop_codon:yes gene_type:complete